MKPSVKLVLAPHPDDEILGAGGAMARWVREGHVVHVAVVTRGCPPLYSDAAEALCREEARAAHRHLGVATTRFLDFPAAGLDVKARADLLALVRRLAGSGRTVVISSHILPELQRLHSLAIFTAPGGTLPSLPADTRQARH